METLRRFALILLTTLCSGVAGRGQISAGASPSVPLEPWPRADVEVKDSPRTTAGILPNGLRYAILRHANPAGRVSLRLLVRAGSLHENDDERGYAHFVEHMAFNGTQHFPAGELVKFLQRQGAQVGPHINAFTSHMRTLYKLELPDNAAATLDTGLRIFRDFAGGMLFEPTQVRRERGVILSEWQARQTPQTAETLARINFFYAGNRVSQRDPIGLPAQIERADHVGLRRFYDAWYRPERLHVVVVGDIDPLAIEELIRAQFSSLAPRGSARDEPVLGKVRSLTQPPITVYRRPILGMDIHFVSITDRPELPNTWGNHLKGMMVRAAVAMLNERLSQISERPERIINDAFQEVTADYLKFRRAAIGVSAAPDRLTEAMAILEQELRRAIAVGFEPAELAQVQKAVRTSMRNVAAGIPSTHASEIADTYAEFIEDNSPLRLIDESLEELLQTIDQLTPESCRRALEEVFTASTLHIFVSCSADAAPSVEKVREAYVASQAVPVGGTTFGGEVTFAYEDFGVPGNVVEKNHIADLDVWQLRLANDVRVNLKRTVFERGHARFWVRFGYGRLTEPADQPALGLWIPFLLYGGPSRHTFAEMRRIRDGLDEMTFSAGEDAFAIKGELPASNLPRALRQLTALMGDPAFRKEGWEATHAVLRGWITPLWNQPEGNVQQHLFPLLAGRDPRIGIPADNVYSARTPEQFSAWMAPQLASGPLEISLVGDFDPETVATELARTFGTLPQRQPRMVDPALTKLNLHRDRTAARYYYGGTADRPSRLEFFWPVRDPLAIRERRRLGMLAEIFLDRVKAEIRENKSATYSPSVGVTWSETYPGFSFVRCTLDVKPGTFEKYSAAMRKMAETLAEKGITTDELARIKAQMLSRVRHARTENDYWLEGVLSDLHQRPSRADAARSAESDHANATKEQLDELARRYFGKGKVFHYLLEPNARKPAPKAK